MSHDRLHRCASNILALTPYLHSPTSSEGGCEPFSHPNREPARATWLRPPRKNRSHHARAEVLPSPQRANIAPNQIPGQRNGKGSQRATAMRCIGTAMRAMHEKNLRLCDCWLLCLRCTSKMASCVRCPSGRFRGRPVWARMTSLSQRDAELN